VVIWRGRGSIVEIEEDEIDRAVAEIRLAKVPVPIVERLLGWKLEPTARRLQRLASQAQAIAARTGKGNIDVVLEGNDLRLPITPWRPFWAAISHAIRNAIDHGIESPEERQALQKEPVGQIRLVTRRQGNFLLVEVHDDGRGVDWAMVAIKARAAGLPADSRQDLTAALFCDGLTTKDVVTEYSGRGVGMGALRAGCESTGGSVDIESVVGGGTVVRCSWSWEIVVRQGSPLEPRAAS
jgi:two-component system chemotaxis sensor kinase CheA